MPEEQWAPVQLTGELILLEIAAVPDAMVPSKAVPDTGSAVSAAVSWAPIQTQE